jgi:hypothetical protein
VIFRGGIIWPFGFGNPSSLLGRHARNGGIERDKPLGFVVGGAELREQDGLQGRRRSSGLGSLREDEGAKKEQQHDRFDRHSVIALREIGGLLRN